MQFELQGRGRQTHSVINWKYLGRQEWSREIYWFGSSRETSKYFVLQGQWALNYSSPELHQQVPFAQKEMVHLTSSDCPLGETSLATGAKKVWESKPLLLLLPVVDVCCDLAVCTNPRWPSFSSVYKALAETLHIANVSFSLCEPGDDISSTDWLLSEGLPLRAWS